MNNVIENKEILIKKKKNHSQTTPGSRMSTPGPRATGGAADPLVLADLQISCICKTCFLHINQSENKCSDLNIFSDFSCKSVGPSLLE